MRGWKPPRTNTRASDYAKRLNRLSDAEKLEAFDTIVGAAFRKGYAVRKGDERKMRKQAAAICDAVEANAVKQMDVDPQNREFWNGTAAGAGQCAAAIRGEHEHDD